MYWVAHKNCIEYLATFRISSQAPLVR